MIETYFKIWLRWCSENGVKIPQTDEGKAWDFFEWMVKNEPQAVEQIQERPALAAKEEPKCPECGGNKFVSLCRLCGPNCKTPRHDRREIPCRTCHGTGLAAKEKP